jgi:hypothetical protein
VISSGACKSHATQVVECKVKRKCAAFEWSVGSTCFTCFHRIFSATDKAPLSKYDSISDKEASPLAVLQERKLDIF